VKSKTLAALVLCMAAPAWSQMALPLDQRQARTWAATCAACHGSDGKAQGAIPSISGRDAEQLYRTLLEFKNGQRPAATVMHQHAKGYTDDELRRIAQAFAAQSAK
jgi:sulfide dehydrogenase cytochrome subunit